MDLMPIVYMPTVYCARDTFAGGLGGSINRHSPIIHLFVTMLFRISLCSETAVRAIHAITVNLKVTTAIY